MHVRTEDLLRIRDGDPIDAQLRERILADAENVREIRRLQRVGNALRSLPDRAPPRNAWARIAAAAHAPPRPRRRVRTAGIAAAVTLAAVAGWLSLRALEAPSLEPGAAPAPVSAGGPSPALPGASGAAAARRSPEASMPGSSAAPADAPYASLLEESARLERVLTQLDARPRRVNAATAVTIVDLEDRVAVLDEQLSFAAARGIDEHQRHALWRERVDMMNALVQVRYAQLQTLGPPVRR